MAKNQTVSAQNTVNSALDQMDPQLVLAWLARSGKVSSRVAAHLGKAQETAEKSATEDKVLLPIRTKREKNSKAIEAMKEKHAAELSSLLEQKKALDTEEDEARAKHGLPARRGAALVGARAARGSAAKPTSEAIRAVWDVWGTTPDATIEKTTIEKVSGLDAKTFKAAYLWLSEQGGLRGSRAGVKRLVDTCPELPTPAPTPTT